MKILKEVRPLRILMPNFKNTNGSVGYRHTFQMSIKSTNDVFFFSESKQGAIKVGRD